MSTVTVKISGLNLPRLVNRLVEKNICLNNLKIKPKFIKFEIDEANLSALDAVCKTEHKYYTIISKNGFKRVLGRLPYLFGAFLALIISSAYLFSFNQFVFDVELSYNSNLPYDMTKVESVLKENGIVPGMKKRDLNISDLQNLLLLGVEDISGCSVKVMGGKVCVCVYPATEKYEVNESDIVSKYNAVVTDAEAYSGELMVGRGDIVQVGDVLIKNNNGASGKVEGKVYFVSTIIYNENQQYLEKTGREYKVRNINFLNIFSIKGQNRCDFSSFVTEKCDFYVSKNYLFPISVTDEIYYEVEIKSKVVPFEEVETSITGKAYAEAIKKVPDPSKVENVTYSVVKEGSYTRVDCFVETIISLF